MSIDISAYRPPPDSQRYFLVVRVAWCLLLIFLVGCHQGVYHASSLPPELAAPPVVSLDSFRMTQLGSCADAGEGIQPGDALQIAIGAGDEPEAPAVWKAVVGRDGTVAVPLVGPVPVAGRPPAAAADAIRLASVRRGIYVNPVVSVTFEERKANRVTVLGAVEKPGMHELQAGRSTLATALVAAGGLSERASPIVEIQNPIPPGRSPTGGPPAPNSVLIRLNLLDADAASGAVPSYNDPWLGDGAVVTVLEKPPRYITVMGLTGNRIMPLPPDRPMRLLDALAEAGGPKHSIWIANKVKVIRQIPGTDQTATIVGSIRKAKRDSAENIRLAAGDIVSVEENAVTFTIDTISSLLGVGVTAARIGYGAY